MSAKKPTQKERLLTLEALVEKQRIELAENVERLRCFAERCNSLRARLEDSDIAYSGSCLLANEQEIELRQAQGMIRSMTAKHFHEIFSLKQNGYKENIWCCLAGMAFVGLVVYVAFG